MTAGNIRRVSYDSLNRGSQLGRGGQGTVYQVTNKKINEADGGGWEVAYKEYSTAVLSLLDADVLASSVALPGTLSAVDGRWLCEKTAWPAAVVESQGSIRGFLMRAVPDRFRFTFQSLAGASTGTKRLANLEYLLNEDSYVAGVGLSISDSERLVLLADIASTLSRLHRIGVTVGDLSPKNLLFTTTPRPECFLLDCDAMRLAGATALPQAETPDWEIPVGEERATGASDVYKLALLAIRLMGRDQSVRDPAVLGTFGVALEGLASASLDTDPSRRPSPTVWAEQLRTASHTASTTRITAARPRPAHTTAASGGSAGTRSPMSNAAPAQRTAPGQQSTTTGVLVAAAIVALLLVAALWPDGNSSDTASGDTVSRSSPTATDTEWTPDETTDEPTDDDPDDDYRDEPDDDYRDDEPTEEEPTEEEPTEEEDSLPQSPTPTPDATERAFKRVSPGDCLPVYDTGYGGEDVVSWSTEVPPAPVSCGSVRALVQVSRTNASSCPIETGKSSWSYTSVSTGGDTRKLCLTRIYHVNYCMLGEQSADLISLGSLTRVDCDRNQKVPAPYNQIMHITGVYNTSKGTDASLCRRVQGDRTRYWAWVVDGGQTLLCTTIYRGD
ncbi:serine/threonine-protein kinase [Streptomyces sp. O3]